MKGLSTLEEILDRRDPYLGGKAKIFSIEQSELKPDRYIVIFKDGSQANINNETKLKLWQLQEK